jgi:hypothetical protein
VASPDSLIKPALRRDKQRCRASESAVVGSTSKSR